MIQDTDQLAETGSGSGGGTSQANPQFADGLHTVLAQNIEFIAGGAVQVPPASSSNITLLADVIGMNGEVDIRGSQGVRITSGPPMLPPVNTGSTNGIEMVASEIQNITIQRGLIDGVDQKIEMAPASIVIDGGVGTITIQSLTEITLSVAGGLSTIKLTPAGIQIQGILVQIN